MQQVLLHTDLRCCKLRCSELKAASASLHLTLLPGQYRRCLYLSRVGKEGVQAIEVRPQQETMIISIIISIIKKDSRSAPTHAKTWTCKMERQI